MIYYPQILGWIQDNVPPHFLLFAFYQLLQPEVAT